MVGMQTQWLMQGAPRLTPPQARAAKLAIGTGQCHVRVGGKSSDRAAVDAKKPGEGVAGHPFQMPQGRARARGGPAFR